MKLRIESNNENKHRDLILKHLREHNDSHTGDRKRLSYYVYAFLDDKLVGGMHAELGWDFIHITKQYYFDLDTLKALLSNVFSHFKEHAVASLFESSDPKSIEDYKVCGYHKIGCIKDLPKGKNLCYYDNRVLAPLEYKNNYILKSNDKDFKEYNDEIDKLIPKDDTPQINIEYLAYDDDNFVAGISGYIRNDYLYVSLVVVLKEYRGKRIASKLMDLLEEDALNRGINNFYLGTTNFQALDFYKKRGYQHIFTIKNFPKGFEDYTLIKSVK